MIRIISGVLSLALALPFILPASAPAYADTGQQPKMLPAFNAVLSVRAPGSAEVSQPVTITVFGKRNHETIAGASVYALKMSDLVTPADSDNYTALLDRYEALAISKGRLLGITGENGTVQCNFTESGRFLLVATLQGYVPGFGRINVLASAKNQLGLKAPQSATINQQVTITAIERSSGQPVEGATVYAFGPNIRLKPNIRPAPEPSENGTATAVLLDANFADSISSDEAGSLLVQSSYQPIQIGKTNASGQVTYVFSQQGVYTLVVFKDGYQPGGKKINILLAQTGQALVINAPIATAAGQSVYLNVWERGSKQPVAGAFIYLLRIGDIPASRPPLPPISANLSVSGAIKAVPPPIAKALKDNVTPDFKPRQNTGVKLMPPTAKNDKAKSNNFNQIPGANVLPWASVVAPLTPYDPNTVKAKGQLIGSTGDNGQLIYTFSAGGRYALAAFKDGYSPAVVFINVGGATTTDNTTQ